MIRITASAIIGFIAMGVATATPLTQQEMLEFAKSGTATCIAKQNANRNLTFREKEGVNLYCTCHSNLMSTFVTKEEMLQITKGVVPSKMVDKVAEARKQCINALSK